MQLIACISFLAALHATTSPNSFPAALILSILVIFQGFWFVNMGFVLWVPSLVPRGCFNQSMNLTGGAVVCGGREADLRARALANLQFCWIFSSISILVASISVIFGRQLTLRRTVEYEQLSNRSGSHDDRIATVGCKQIQL
ncbi:hypothetical protein OROMI_025296 [Orobanche minor]